MKNYLSVFIPFLCAISFIGCSSNLDTCEDVWKKSHNSDLESFVLSVDSLNATFSSYSRKQVRRDGINLRNFKSGAGVALADYAGGILGKQAGRWGGAVLGSLGANPFTPLLGAAIGKRVGYVAGMCVASGLANMWLSCNVKTADSAHSSLDFKPDFSFSDIIPEEEDSIGYIHNYVMVKILENKDKYGYGKSINTSLLYDDIIEYCKECGCYQEEFANNEELKNTLINEMEKYCAPAIDYEGGNMSDEQLIKCYSDILKTSCKCSEEELEVFNEFTGKLVLKCTELDDVQIVQYATGLNNIIKTSSFTSQQKVEIAKSSNAIISSTLCWKQ